MKTSMADLLKELDEKSMFDADREARLMNWFAECVDIVRQPGETNEALADRIKERIASNAVQKAIEEE